MRLRTVGYIKKANEFCVLPPLSDFRHGQGFPEKIMLPFDGKRFIYAHKTDPSRAPKGGVISYRLGDLDPGFDPYAVPVTVPQSKWNLFKQLINDMIDSETPRNLAWQFFHENSELIKIAIIAGSVGILANIYLTGQSGGVTSPATIPAVMMAGVLVSVAMTFDVDNPPPAGT